MGTEAPQLQQVSETEVRKGALDRINCRWEQSRAGISIATLCNVPDSYIFCHGLLSPYRPAIACLFVCLFVAISNPRAKMELAGAMLLSTPTSWAHMCVQGKVCSP